MFPIAIQNGPKRYTKILTERTLSLSVHVYFCVGPILFRVTP